ncbi:MAG: ArnT family glycosyltransferase, partial [Longimicrobiales bacterium]
MPWRSPLLGGSPGAGLDERDHPPLRMDLIRLCVLGVALRIAVAVLWAPAPTGDAVDYLRLAEGLLNGDGFRNTNGLPTSWRPPLYPIFLALVVGSAGVDGATPHALIRICQALIGTASVLLVYFVGRLWFGRTVGWIAGLLMATSFAQVAAVSRVLSETLFVFLLLAGIALASVGWTGGRGQRAGEEWSSTYAWPYLASGFCLGLATLAKGALLPFAPVLALGIVGVSLRLQGRSSIRWTLPRA